MRQEDIQLRKTLIRGKEYWDLIVHEVVFISMESFSVVDQIRNKLLDIPDGMVYTSEMDEVAEVIKKHYFGD